MVHAADILSILGRCSLTTAGDRGVKISPIQFVSERGDYT